MSVNTKISWTDATWNPVTGCTPKSEGCANCYAKRMAKRLAGRCGYPADDPFRVTMHEDKLEEPLNWKKPRRVFVCSMGDLFHEDVSFDFIDKIFDVMWNTPRHRYQLLTKRPKRMVDYIYKRASHRSFGWTDYERGAIEPGDTWHIDDIRMRNICGFVGEDDDARGLLCLHPDKHGDGECDYRECPIAYEVTYREALAKIGVDHEYEFEDDGFTEEYSGWMKIHSRPLNAWPGNVWLGFSAENQETFTQRMVDFRPLRWRLPKEAILFWSYEPALGPVNTSIPYWPDEQEELNWSPFELYEFQTGQTRLEVPYLNWIIAGGESGPGARPMHPDWVRSLRDQCNAADVNFHFKQWGSNPHESAYLEIDRKINARIEMKNRGNLLDGELWQEFPETR